MRPIEHLFWGAVLSAIISFVAGFGLLKFAIIYTSSILIDLDHVSRYIIKEKNISVKRFFRYYEKEFEKIIKTPIKKRRKLKYPFFVFHGIEAILMLFILSYKHWIFSFILIGFLIHLVLDYAQIISEKMPLDYKISQIYVLIKNKRAG